MCDYSFFWKYCSGIRTSRGTILLQLCRELSVTETSDLDQWCTDGKRTFWRRIFIMKNRYLRADGMKQSPLRERMCKFGWWWHEIGDVRIAIVFFHVFLVWQELEECLLQTGAIRILTSSGDDVKSGSNLTARCRRIPGHIQCLLLRLALGLDRSCSIHVIAFNDWKVFKEKHDEPETLRAIWLPDSVLVTSEEETL